MDDGAGYNDMIFVARMWTEGRTADVAIAGDPQSRSRHSSGESCCVTRAQALLPPDHAATPPTLRSIAAADHTAQPPHDVAATTAAPPAKPPQSVGLNNKDEQAWVTGLPLNFTGPTVVPPASDLVDIFSRFGPVVEARAEGFSVAVVVFEQLGAQRRLRTAKIGALANLVDFRLPFVGRLSKQPSLHRAP
ncbi:hypothetical protein ZWY2020_045103 [Hordeum vulgare]|nr:hypothetical protein ZWY2020_045103 [Hordeum vulgare]